MTEPALEGVREVPPEYGPPFHHALGIRMGLGADGAGVAWIDVDPSKHYGARWAHGGIVPALADISSGIVISATLAHGRGKKPEEVIDGTIEIKANFLLKVREGSMVATARLAHAGRRIAVTDVDVTNEGRLVAKALCTFMLHTE